MKNIVLLFTLLFVFFACNKDERTPDESYIVEIDIIQPEENAAISVGDNLPIEVRFSRPNNQIIHNVLIEILDSDGAVIRTIRNKHEHVNGEVTFKQNDAFTANETGRFTLKVETTNFEGEEPNDAIRSFSVN